MPSFLVDPLVFTVPPTDASHAKAQSWLVALEKWVYEISGSPYDWRHVTECSLQLYAQNRLPDFTTLRAMVVGYQVDLNVGMLARWLGRFFQDEDRGLSKRMFTQVAYFEQLAPDIQPDEFLSRNLESVQPELANALGCLTCDNRLGLEFAASLCVLTVPFANGAEVISVEGQLQATEPDSVIQRIPEREVRAEFRCVFTPDDLIGLVDTLDLVRSPSGFAQAVREAATTRWSEVGVSYSLGSEFFASLANSGIASDSSALDKLVRVSAAIVCRHAQNINLAVRPVRVNPSPNSPQIVRSRDGATGWRATITTRGPGWRLHYWHVPSRGLNTPEDVEFSLVLRESDPVRMANSE